MYLKTTNTDQKFKLDFVVLFKLDLLIFFADQNIKLEVYYKSLATQFQNYNSRNTFHESGVILI